MDDFSNPEEKVPDIFQCPLHNSPKVKGLEYQGVEALPWKTFLAVCYTWFRLFYHKQTWQEQKKQNKYKIQILQPLLESCWVLEAVTYFTYMKIYLEQKGTYKSLTNLV